MARKKLNSPDLFINRELSWLRFNYRVLQEGLSPDPPLMERLKFLAIFSSNLDEFFMIRVAGLMHQRAAKLRRRDPSGLTPAQQLARISERVHEMVQEQTAGIDEALGGLSRHGLRVVAPHDWSPEQRRFIRSYFSAEVLPVVTPLAVQELDPVPLLPALGLNVALLLDPPGGRKGRPRIVVVPVPRQLPRFVAVPAHKSIDLARLEDVIAASADLLLPDSHILSSAAFRITRDADVEIQDDEAGDLLHMMEQAVLARRRRVAVRLELTGGTDPRLTRWLTRWLALRPEEVYEIDGMLDAAALMEIVSRQGFDDLRNPDWPPQTPRDLAGADDLWQALSDHDVLLIHPYESFEPVVRLIEQAADDPNVLAIKQTLYRTSGDSPIIRALGRAADAGKQVIVLVELRARFDEARNVNWARRLEDAGCTVIYGVAGFKTHAKALLIVRREGGRIQRYVHLATGNYNDTTAKLYSDIALMTSDRGFAGDVAALFNLLTGYSEVTGWSRITCGPTGLRQAFLDLIDREIRVSSPDHPGRIMVKVNSLEDIEICRALYLASQAGVSVRLNVRGICCLRPGVKGVSENIEVRSVVDRFLEHARVFCFHNGGHEEVYLSSADWMKRNLDKRLELLFPVTDPALRRRLSRVMATFFADNVKAQRLLADGTYERVVRRGRRVRAQERLYEEAAEAARLASQPVERFRPLTRPDSA